MRLLVCGGAGFIGSNYVRLVLQSDPDIRVTVLDALTYAGNLASLRDVAENPRFRFVKGKIQDEQVVADVVRDDEITHIVNFAAESHNDRSLLDSASFIQTDVYGVYILLEAVKKFDLERMLHVSTDEVYGTISEGEFTEESSLLPNTPYSASKAGGDLQVRAHHIAFGTNVVVTRGGNTYGPYQYPEKLISFFITRMLQGKKVPMYGEGNQVREWIHVLDHCQGIHAVLLNGVAGEFYNVGDTNEKPNREVVQLLLKETGGGEELVKKVPDPRGRAHDQRYSMTCQKARALGWRPERAFDEHLKATVDWYRENEWWWRPIVASDEYQSFVKKFYGPLLAEDL